jgi:UTP:GlnB (protein PII) uridylyltransferase
MVSILNPSKRYKDLCPKIDPKYFLLPAAGAQFLQILKSTTNLSTILKKLKQLGFNEAADS